MEAELEAAEDSWVSAESTSRNATIVGLARAKCNLES